MRAQNIKDKLLYSLGSAYACISFNGIRCYDGTKQETS